MKIFIPEIQYRYANYISGKISNDIEVESYIDLSSEDWLIDNSIFSLIFSYEYEYPDYIYTVTNITDNYNELFKNKSLIRRLEIYRKTDMTIYIIDSNGEDIFNFQEDIFILDLLREKKDPNNNSPIDLSSIDYDSLTPFQKVVYLDIVKENDDLHMYHDSDLLNELFSKQNKTLKDRLALTYYLSNIFLIVDRLYDAPSSYELN